MQNNLLGAICLSLAASIWGGMYVVSKYVLAFIPPITLVWLRYIIAFAVLFILLKIFQRRNNSYVKIKKQDWILLAWIGFIGYFLSICLQFIGTNLSDAHTGALITSATPAFIVLFAQFILGEKLTREKALSLILASVGVVIVIGWDVEIGAHLWGNIALVGAALTWALLSVYVKVASKRLNSLTITTYGILFALIFTTPLMLWELQTNLLVFHNKLVILGLFYLGVVSTAGAFFLWNKGMELMDAGVGSLFFFFQPLVGSFLGWLWLNEQLTTGFFVGGLLIILGVLIVTIKKETENKVNEIRTN